MAININPKSEKERKKRYEVLGGPTRPTRPLKSPSGPSPSSGPPVPDYLSAGRSAARGINTGIPVGETKQASPMPNQNIMPAKTALPAVIPATAGAPSGLPAPARTKAITPDSVTIPGTEPLNLEPVNVKPFGSRGPFKGGIFGSLGNLAYSQGQALNAQRRNAEKIGEQTRKVGLFKVMEDVFNSRAERNKPLITDVGGTTYEQVFNPKTGTYETKRSGMSTKGSFYDKYAHDAQLQFITDSGKLDKLEESGNYDPTQMATLRAEHNKRYRDLFIKINIARSEEAAMEKNQEDINALRAMGWSDEQIAAQGVQMP